MDPIIHKHSMCVDYFAFPARAVSVAKETNGGSWRENY